MVSTLDFRTGGESGKRISNGGFMSNLILQQHFAQAKRYHITGGLKR